MSKFQVSWQQVVIVVAVLGAVSYFVLAGHGDKLETVGMGVLALLALVARSPFASGSPPAVAPSETFPAESPTKKQGRSVPPPLPVIFMVLALVAGCHEMTPAEKAAAADAAYKAEIVACATSAKTRAEGEACIADVDRRWTQSDAGADR